MKDYILVVGGSTWDRTYRQKKDLTYPKTPDFEMPGGKGANQAVASARADYPVKMMSVVGDDEVGRKVVDNLIDNHIDVSAVKVIEGIKTDVCDIFVSQEGENAIKRSGTATKSFTIEYINENAELIKNSACVVTQSKLPKEVYSLLIDYCHKNGVLTVLTPCPSYDLKITDEGNKELLDKVSVITANESEAKEITQSETIEEAIQKLPNMIVTAGERGAYFMSEGKIVNIPAMTPQEIVDTTGAGDTLCGNFVARILKGYTKEEAIKMGIKASTLKLEKVGAQPGMPYASELEDEYEDELWREKKSRK